MDMIFLALKSFWKIFGPGIMIEIRKREEEERQRKIDGKNIIKINMDIESKADRETRSKDLANLLNGLE